VSSSGRITARIILLGAHRVKKMRGTLQGEPATIKPKQWRGRKGQRRGNGWYQKRKYRQAERPYSAKKFDHYSRKNVREW
jgi:hypothetical protein